MISKNEFKKLPKQSIKYVNRKTNYHNKNNLDNDKTEWHKREPINNPNYKTAICTNFIYGKCKYGDRCVFAHGENDLHIPKFRNNKKSEKINIFINSKVSQTINVDPHSLFQYPVDYIINGKYIPVEKPYYPDGMYWKHPFG